MSGEEKKKRSNWSTIKVRNEIKQQLQELKRRMGYKSYNELIKHLIMCELWEEEHISNEMRKAAEEIFK